MPNYHYKLRDVDKAAIRNAAPTAVTRILGELGFPKKVRQKNPPAIESWLNLYDVLRQVCSVITRAPKSSQCKRRSNMTVKAFYRLYPKFLSKEALGIGGERSCHILNFQECNQPKQVLEAIFADDDDWLVYEVLAEATFWTIIELAKDNIGTISYAVVQRIVDYLKFEKHPKYAATGPQLLNPPRWGYVCELLSAQGGGQTMATKNVAIIFRKLCPTYMDVPGFIGEAKKTGIGIADVMSTVTADADADELWETMRGLEHDTICYVLRRVIKNNFHV